MNKELYDLLNSAGEIRIEIGGKEKYRHLTNEEIILLLDAMEALDQQQKQPLKKAA